MSVAATRPWSWRQEQAESSRLAWAFGISLAVHLLIFGCYYTDHKYHWSQSVHWPGWLRPVKVLVELLKRKEVPKPPPSEQQEPPLMFVDVSSAQSTPEAPKTAKYYSDKNSKAANTEPDKETGAPNITGTQTEMVKTEDVPRETRVPLQPAPPPRPAQQAQEAQEEVVAKPAQAPGDVTMAKPDPEPKKDESQATKPVHTRPRLLAQVQPQPPPQENRLAGQKMKQEGGVHRIDMPSLDTEATPLGLYDRALIDAVANCWYGLLDAQAYALDYRGKVMLEFQLHSDGRVSDIKIAENTTGESVPGLLCQTAIDKPNPYAAFPPEVRRIVGETRHIQFTFYYSW
jgi:outer membrane biosynthesis protein TonB